ncbi:DUF5335 domain-containing protein [Shewanella schlegeliana]|uniref:DUF5335 family protein n=1 Tax=Shewanella schlegeliana TaxID=190308 RepID=A0ABS1SYU0_9GAMM|nr:DUF5335 family protein [Shewanella schlegeliana]MBL4913728.1 DUF5335 family protein [Shewanella schlegeliana]MCL1111555.1 DUF5335 domain-containing protein [Shewanella schlegeliana]GIU36738.1 hypothetical protein TUM4433_35950 [Shewanella schlegeliana]
MQQTKQLHQADWLDHFVTFSNGNKGRMITIEMVGLTVGDQPLADASPLLAIDYDPVNKGDKLTISTGTNSIDYTHTISEPNKIWQQQDDNGKVISLEIINQTNTSTIITFKS